MYMHTHSRYNDIFDIFLPLWEGRSNGSVRAFLRGARKGRTVTFTAITEGCKLQETKLKSEHKHIMKAQISSSRFMDVWAKGKAPFFCSSFMVRCSCDCYEHLQETWLFLRKLCTTLDNFIKSQNKKSKK